MSDRKISGYTFGENARCPECVGYMILGSITPSGRDREALRTDEVERLLDQRAEAVGVDREDESSFDEAKDFPKRIYEGSDRECVQCGRSLSVQHW